MKGTQLTKVHNFLLLFNGYSSTMGELNCRGDLAGVQIPGLQLWGRNPMQRDKDGATTYAAKEGRAYNGCDVDQLISQLPDRAHNEQF